MISYSHLLYLALPQVILVITALLLLAADLIFLRASTLQTRIAACAALSILGCAAAIGWILHAPQVADVAGMLVLNPLVQHIQLALIVLTILTTLLFLGSTFTRHVSEYLSLILLATVGMMFLVSTQNLLVLFLSLELLSLSLYVLTAFDKRSAKSAESALKYFLFGGISAAFLLFGFSLLFGLANSTNLSEIASAIHAGPLDPLLIVAILMTIVGLAFKVAAVPLHFWAPDVYQGAPAPSAGLIASSSKVASFFIFFQLMAVGLAGASGSASWHAYAPGWVPILAVLATLSMLLGNLVAIRQTSVRRLLAYSAIAHGGYMLLGIMAHTQQSFAALLYYAVTYALTVLGAFGFLEIVEERTGGDTFADLAGFSRIAPIPSLCMFVFILSLAGIPPLAGFFSKFYLFSVALIASPGLLWLVVLAIAMSAVSLYYYLRILKSIYVADPPPAAVPLHVPAARQIVLCLLAVATLILGCAPNLLLRWL